MMECNKTPDKYHVYCQNAGENKNYIRNNGSDLFSLLKENKQLKAMLILHLDLIQEQSDQIAAKDKQLDKLKDDVQALRSKVTQLESFTQDLQRQLQRQIKRAVAPQIGEMALLSPPPLAKIQCKTERPSASPTNIIGECNGKIISKIVLQRVGEGMPIVEATHSPNSTTTSEDATASKHRDEDEETEEVTTEESNDAVSSTNSKKQQSQVSPSNVNVSRGAKPRRPIGTNIITTVTTPTTTTTTIQVCVTPPTPSRGKQMPLMLWHAHSEEESISCESNAEVEQANSQVSLAKTSSTEIPKAITRGSRLEHKPKIASQNQAQHSQRQTQSQPQPKRRRCAFITTPLEYATREWEDEDEQVCDYEFSQAEADELYAEAPNLEIPKWTEHELTPSYSIEGTEDLSDELFVKRHAKLEADEKRRKKWDVQQIREQRRIEKLKRRHCKEEPIEQQPLKSFYPQSDGIQSICFVNELPVQAFGEMIPKLSPNTEFVLPWTQVESAPSTSAVTPVTTVEVATNSTNSSTSTQSQQQLSKSTYVFLKKRKRQQSASVAATGGGSARQRTLAAVKAVQQTTAPTAPVTASTTPQTSTTTNSTAASTTVVVTPITETQMKTELK